LISRLQRTTHILIVGWRGMDKHFTKLLSEHTPAGVKVHIVCGGPQHGTDVQDVLVKEGLAAIYTHSGDTFSSYVLNRAGKAFLTEAARPTLVT
jgi:hypothetical protein